MTGDAQSLSHHPAPHGDKLSRIGAFFLLFTGPMLWFVDFNIGAALMSWPCFPSLDRLIEPRTGTHWTFPAALILIVLSTLAAIAVSFAAFRLYRQVSEEHEGGHHHLAEVGGGRTRVIALWAVYLNAGAAVSILVVLVYFLGVPRCAN